jgi:hypothetical protein
MFSPNSYLQICNDYPFKQLKKKGMKIVGLLRVRKFIRNHTVMQILQEKHTKSTSRLTCQQDNLNPPTFYLTVSYSAQQLASIWHCRPQACLLYFSIQFVPSQIGKAWPRFLHFQPLMHLLFDLRPGNRNNHLIYMIPNKKTPRS